MLILASLIIVSAVSVLADIEPADVLYERTTIHANSNYDETPLAAATGIDQSDISKIERGVANPSISTLERIRYYNTERIQRKLRLMTPAEYHEHYFVAA